MKRFFLSGLAGLAVVLCGCGKSEQSNPTSSAPAQPTATNTNQQDSVGQAVEKYGRTMATVQKRTLEKTDLISVDRAIQAFQADRAKNPESLEELIKEGFLPKLPELPKGKKYSYDAQTGEVKAVDAN